MNLNNAIARAQRLMLNEDWNRQVELGAAAQRGKSINGGGGNDLSAFEAQAFGYSSSPTDNTYEKNSIPQEAYNRKSTPVGYENVQIIQETKRVDKSKSKMPKEVLESFEKVPSMTQVDTGGYQQVPASYFEGIPKTITEQSQQTTVPSMGIDYKYIKYLIDESIKEHLSSTLNESVGIKGLRISNGNIIQFLDSKGNLYEGKLTLKKKATQ